MIVFSRVLIFKSVLVMGPGELESREQPTESVMRRTTKMRSHAACGH